jgi:hypothetical protein
MPSWGGAASGAGTGAAIGSFLPGIGTLVGGGIGGLIGGLFGHGKKKDDQQDDDPFGKAHVGSIMDLLQANADRNKETAGLLRQQSTEAIGPAMQYLSDLAGNDPTARADATKAERGKIMDQYDAGRRSIAQFGARGGASNLALAQSYTDQAAQTSDLLSTQRQSAAQALAGMGIQLSSLGLTAESLSNASLDDILSAITGQQQLDLQKRGQTMNMWGGIGSAAGGLLGAWLLGRK